MENIDINTPLLAAGPTGHLPLKSYYPEGWIYLEPSKNVYYPGEVMEVAINLGVEKEIEHAESILVNIKGKESFKFNSTNSKNHRSIANKRVIVNETFSLCRFAPSFLA